MDVEKFITKSNSIHNNKYNYSLTLNPRSHDNIEIICPKHGLFVQRAIRHLNGSGCKKCYRENRIIELSNRFIAKAGKIHNNKYDYSKVKYCKCNVKVEIICPKHGSFWQIPSSHLSGKGCLKCANNGKCTKTEFVEKAKKVHSNKYDYSRIKYDGNKSKIKIICPEHGVFEQSPNAHLRYGCKKCADIKISESRVVGGASKLFKYFIDEHNPDKIISYCNRRYGIGNVYKNILKNFDFDLTEAENMFNNGYRRIWDAGNYKFGWKR